MELLQFIAPNLCGFDPVLAVGSRQATISNLEISLVPYLPIRKESNDRYKSGHSVVTCATPTLDNQNESNLTKFRVCFYFECNVAQTSTVEDIS